VRVLFQLAKEIAAFVGSTISIFFGLSLVLAAFDLAVSLQRQLWLLIPCFIVAAVVPVFLVGIPRFIYRWRYNFPKVRRA
jgi:hypothetical protein